MEIRANQVKLDGYVNVPARDSRILPSPKGNFIEQIMPKVFERALGRTNNVDLLFNHDKSRKLGSIQEGNVQMYEDNIGLRAITTVTDAEVIQKAKNGELRGWSFAFKSNKDTWKDGEDGIQRRYVEDLDLLEISILDQTPAYHCTSIETRGDEILLFEQRNEEFRAEINHIEDPKPIEEIIPQAVFLYEKEINFLKLKGGTFK